LCIGSGAGDGECRSAEGEHRPLEAAISFFPGFCILTPEEPCIHMCEPGRILEAEPGHLDRMTEIEGACFAGPAAYSRRKLHYLAFLANSTCYVETDGTAIRGFIIVMFRRGCRISVVETIDVDPNFQGKGIGLRLLNAAEKDMLKKRCRISRLQVAVGNIPAIRLYEKAGYRATRLLLQYYRFASHGTRDAWRMEKNLG